MTKFFDLNIGKILEHWEICFAIRELIANAIDESVLSKSDKPFDISHNKDICTIRDFGRGINYEHFIQNESTEKLNDLTIIGKFGFGLKDAIATFYRNGIEIVIQSKFGIMSVIKQAKHKFTNIETLHVQVDEPFDTNFIGTLITLKGVKEEDVIKGKQLFLIFSDDNKNILLNGSYGQIIKKTTLKANIYINGIKVADEDNFNFSYNITSITGTMRKALNRERNNVGRTVYGDRISKILCQIDKNKMNIAKEIFMHFAKNSKPDDINYKDVQVHIIKLCNSNNVIFVTQKELVSNKHDVDLAIKEGAKEIVVSDEILKVIQQIKDNNGKEIQTIQTFTKSKNNIEYTEIPYSSLSESEKGIYDTHSIVKNLVYPKNDNNYKLIISSDMFVKSNYNGLCVNNKRIIYIDRSQLQSVEKFTGVLIHELTHFYTGYLDVDRNFESVLTDKLGVLTSYIIGKLL